MAKRKTSIALTPREVERFREAADVRGLSLSEFMSQSTANALDTADATVVLKSFAADLRADITRLMERLLESDVLQAQERSRFLDEQRNVLGNFLEGLKASQREAVKDAFQFGQKHPTTPKPSDQELGIHRPPTPRS
ncbi:hypothetical protein [Pseudoxanthomonas daejeonensis]|uniref:hypothetical protein n=1 Tax=Pseudoxanthomonas daejeonensis TaxID=266062 RepID=UPI001391B380|nr:hypothetical protein [Pseudoxanthomonas daejeonensis]